MPEGTGINVGDAVLTFLGDTTKLDLANAKVLAETKDTAAQVSGAWANTAQGAGVASEAVAGLNVRIATGQAGAKELGDVMELSGEKAKFSMYEARGEVGLLGEEMGVKLPRHVRSFLVELPGVGEAMSAAFSATAVIFLATALIEITKKVSEFAAQLAFHTKSAEENMKSISNLNGQLIVLNKYYQEAKEKVDAYGKSAVELAQEKQAQLIQSVKDLNKELKEEEDNLTALNADHKKHGTVMEDVVTSYKAWRAGTLSATEALGGFMSATTLAMINEKKLEEEQSKLLITHAKLKLATVQSTQAHHDLKDAVKKAAEEHQKLVDKYNKITLEMQKTQLEIDKLNASIAKHGKVVEDVVQVSLPGFAQELINVGHALGDTGQNIYEVTRRVEVQKNAVDLLWKAHLQGIVGIHEFTVAELSEVKAEIELAKALGHSTEALEKREKVLEKELSVNQKKEKGYDKLTKLETIYQKELEKTGSIEKATWKAGEEAMGSAVAAYAMGQASIGASLEKMVQQEMASIAQRATVKAIEELAYGFGTMFTNPPESASHFESAALFGSLGAAAAVAGHAMGSGGTGSGTMRPQQGVQTSGTGVAGGGVPQSGPNIQMLAAGGIVSAPTLAVLGDSKSGGSAHEAVLPLDDPQSMKKLVDALGNQDSGPVIHVHVKGMVSPDNLNKVVQNINKRVKNGQSNLVSSNSMRLTKRSQ